jgi:hypothetical protein
MTARLASYLGNLLLLAMTLIPPPSLGQTVNVTTWHNDNWRTGQNTNETTLTTTLVGDPTKFGRICQKTTLDGKIYPQPLVVPNVNFNNNGTKTVVYVATENDTVYAIDGTNCNVLGQKSLLVGSETAANCHHVAGFCLITPTVGILSTPVIEIDTTSPTTGVLFAVAESESSGPTFYHRIWALDITSLASVNKGPAQVCASGCNGDPTGSQFTHDHLQRPGLLWLPAAQSGLGHNEVYAAFSMMDAAQGNPNGWIWAFNAQNLAAPPLSYETTPETGGSARRHLAGCGRARGRP